MPYLLLNGIVITMQEGVDTTLFLRPRGIVTTRKNSGITTFIINKIQKNNKNLEKTQLNYPGR